MPSDHFFAKLWAQRNVRIAAALVGLGLLLAIVGFPWLLVIEVIAAILAGPIWVPKVFGNHRLETNIYNQPWEEGERETAKIALYVVGYALPGLIVLGIIRVIIGFIINAF